MVYSRGTHHLRLYSDVVRSDSNSSSLRSHQPTSSLSTPDKSSTASSASTGPPLNALTAPKGLNLGYKAHGRYPRGLHTGVQTSKYPDPLVGLGMPLSPYHVAVLSGATKNGFSDSAPAQTVPLATSSTASSFASSRDSEDPADVHHYYLEDYLAFRAARKGKSKVASCSRILTSAPAISDNPAIGNVAPAAAPSAADLESLMPKMTYREHYYITEFSDGRTQLDFYRRPTEATRKAAQDDFDEECRQKALALQKEKAKAKASMTPELVEGLDHTITKLSDGRIERHFHHEAAMRAWQAKQDKLYLERLEEERRQHVLALEKKIEEAPKAGLIPEVTYFENHSIVKFADGTTRLEFYSRMGEAAYYRELEELEDERQRRALTLQREEEAKQRLEREYLREETVRFRTWRDEHLRLASERSFYAYIEHVRHLEYLEWSRREEAMAREQASLWLQRARDGIEARERLRAQIEHLSGPVDISSEGTFSRESLEEWTSLMSEMTASVDEDTRPEFREYAEEHLR
ncbi:hypothetical protein B0A48_13397 [Cryoendolithus antarcticus]|uniref:Uncharacterized protein n=1 Tax=Cryoendolithus antarcticus TaxID=1507870 RepID=A0A1V8SQ46_9PEZI|nr:hypothetical protein B0A48_13397 [Cryoendolithus antarcticus]